MAGATCMLRSPEWSSCPHAACAVHGRGQTGSATPPSLYAAVCTAQICGCQLLWPIRSPAVNGHTRCIQQRLCEQTAQRLTTFEFERARARAGGGGDLPSRAQTNTLCCAHRGTERAQRPAQTTSCSLTEVKYPHECVAGTVHVLQYRPVPLGAAGAHASRRGRRPPLHGRGG